MFIRYRNRNVKLAFEISELEIKIEIHQHIVFFSVLPSFVSDRKRIDWVCPFSAVPLSQNYKFVQRE